MNIQFDRVFSSLGRGFLDLLSPRIWLLILIPPLLSFVLWIGLFAQVKDFLFIVLQSWVLSFDELQTIVQVSFLGWNLIDLVYWMLVLPGLFFVTWMTSVLLVGFLAVPWIRRFLKARYPQALGGRRVEAGTGAVGQTGGGGSILSSLRNLFSVAFQALGFFFLILLFFWVPGVWPIGLFMLAAWGNSRLIFLEVSSEVSLHLKDGQLWEEQKSSFLTLGLIFGFLFTVPLLGFLVPVWTALSFFHYLCQLAEQSGSKDKSFVHN